MTSKGNGQQVGDGLMALEGLIARLEAAVGPDRVLADDVLLACGWVLKDSVWYISDAHAKHEAEPCWPECDNPPDPTASIDAALTLVPEGWGWEQMTWHDSRPPVVVCVSCGNYGRGDNYNSVDGEAPTAPLALCIAALKARAASPYAPQGAPQEPLSG